jgi:hypothetical protein
MEDPVLTGLMNLIDCEYTQGDIDTASVIEHEQVLHLSRISTIY